MRGCSGRHYKCAKCKEKEASLFTEYKNMQYWYLCFHCANELSVADQEKYSLNDI